MSAVPMPGPGRGGPPASGSCSPATCRRRPTRRRAAGSTPAARGGSRPAATTSGRRCARSRPGTLVACHFAERDRRRRAPPARGERGAGPARGRGRGHRSVVSAPTRAPARDVREPSAAGLPARRRRARGTGAAGQPSGRLQQADRDRCAPRPGRPGRPAAARPPVTAYHSSASWYCTREGDLAVGVLGAQGQFAGDHADLVGHHAAGAGTMSAVRLCAPPPAGAGGRRSGGRRRRSCPAPEPAAGAAGGCRPRSSPRRPGSVAGVVPVRSRCTACSPMCSPPTCRSGRPSRRWSPSAASGA